MGQDLCRGEGGKLWGTEEEVFPRARRGLGRARE